jgi:type IV pilus assembly protein PilW
MERATLTTSNAAGLSGPTGEAAFWRKQRASARTQHGLTLIELMIAMAIGLVIIAAASAMFLSSSATRRQIEQSADVIESGRYGVDLLARELSQAGFYGTLATASGNVLDPCSTDPAAWAGSLAMPAMGFNNLQADPPCLARKAGTDAIFIQRASTCTVLDAGSACAEDLANAYLQVSECGLEYNTTPFVLAQGHDAAFTLQTKACDGTTATKRKLIRRIFFISAADVLSYVDITLGGATAPVPMVENIEQMQIEYALDTDEDGTPDDFTPLPADWSQVIGVRVWLLARSADKSSNASGERSFRMSDTTLDVPAAAANFKRRVYSTYIPFMTPKSRRES